MFRGIYTAFFMLMLAMVPLSATNAVELNAKAEQSVQSVLEKDDKGFSYELAGDVEEEIALKLFVKNAASEHEIHDPAADDLNRISPAAGIKLQFGF